MASSFLFFFSVILSSFFNHHISSSFRTSIHILPFANFNVLQLLSVMTRGKQRPKASVSLNPMAGPKPYDLQVLPFERRDTEPMAASPAFARLSEFLKMLPLGVITEDDVECNSFSCAGKSL
jgi:hypothetical protein